MSVDAPAITRRAQIESLAYSFLAAVLVIVFIPTVGVWRWLSSEFGSTTAFLVPVGAAAAVLLVAVLLQLRAGAAIKPVWSFLILSIVIAITALWLSDPKFPAKRIHVAEYFLIALVLRRAFCRWLSGRNLAVMTFVAACLFGVHDELIQGLHPQRTYGLRDIGIDGLGALAGVLAGHGLRLFDGRPKRDEGWISSALWPVFALMIGLAALLIPLPAFRDVMIPWWTITPLLAAGTVWYLSERTKRFWGDPMILTSWMVFATVIYPVLSHVSPLNFR